MYEKKGGKTCFLILGLLATEGPLSGYDIRRLTTIRFQYFWSESYGQIYPELDRLHGEGAIEMETDGTRNGRRRKAYRITEKGVERLRNWLGTPADPEINRYEMLLKVYFGSAGAQGDVIGQIDAFAERYRHARSMLLEHEREVAGLIESSPEHAHVLLAIRFGLNVYDAYLAWARDAVSFLRKGGSA